MQDSFFMISKLFGARRRRSSFYKKASIFPEKNDKPVETHRGAPRSTRLMTCITLRVTTKQIEGGATIIYKLILKWKSSKMDLKI